MQAERENAPRVASWAWTGVAGRLLKEFFYNNFYDRTFYPSEGNGKLYQAKRHNDFGSLDLVATTTHAYGGIGGRLSRRIDATGGDGAVPRVRFTSDFAYDSLGNLAQLTYPTCEQAGCEDAPPDRTVTRGFSRGLLTAVGTATDPDRYASLTYHPNLTVNQVLHGNGVRDVTSQDPDQMPRPGGVEVRNGAGTGLGALWQASYAYDGSGNVVSRAISEYRDDGGLLFTGTDLFEYDPAFNRLVGATIYYPAGAGGSSDNRSFSYDAFGNLLAIGGDVSRGFSTDPDTNRLDAPFTYDAAGNLTSQPDTGSAGSLQQWYYSYDPFHMMTRAFRSAGSITRQYVYTADDERLAVITPSRELWTLRGADAQVLRDVEYVSTGWNWLEDYIHRGSGLLASESDTGTSHYHLDHLGSPRLVTNTAKLVLARHVYAPYGEELTTPLQDETRMKFTGHERDRMDVTDPAGDLDYMHARYYSGNIGRLLSIDPAGGMLEVPGSWNRYSYAMGNPIKFVDPSGAVVSLAGLDDTESQKLLESLQEATGNEYGVDADGNLELISTGAGSSESATGLVNDLISADQTFEVRSCNSCGIQFAVADTAKDRIYLDFNDFEHLDFGRVSSATFGIGMQFLHEGLHQLYPGLDDPSDRGVRGFFVDTINQVRQERGFELRDEYVGQRTYGEVTVFFEASGWRALLGVRNKVRYPYEPVARGSALPK